MLILDKTFLIFMTESEAQILNFRPAGREKNFSICLIKAQLTYSITKLL